MNPSGYEVVIGLETHVELSTETKMFCGCPNRFGAPPNTLVCPVCLGLPGSLPVTNRRAVEYAIRFGRSVGAEIGRAIFHRKNYFYPDLPKGYQISQYDEPICRGGEIEVLTEAGERRRVRVHRAHLEEDTGKSTHLGGGGRIHEAAATLEDYNRAGVPLLEIVSEADIRSPDEARAYVNELRAICELLDISDVKMEEGSLRVDANVSLRPVGAETFGTKVEVKNMNSVRSLGRALAHEVERQTGVLESGAPIVQETRHWNESDGRTHGMRSKEEAFDYRYFPEPDLVPIQPEPEWVAEIEMSVPAKLPAARVAEAIETLGITHEKAAAVVYTRGLADWVDAEVAAGAGAAAAYNWASQEVLAHLNETGRDFPDVAPAAGTFVELTRLAGDGILSSKLAREVLRRVLASGESPAAIVESQGLAQISDTGELERIVGEVVDANPDVVGKYRAGNEKVVGALVGQVMKATQGRANPGTVNELLRARLRG